MNLNMIFEFDFWSKTSIKLHLHKSNIETDSAEIRKIFSFNSKVKPLMRFIYSLHLYENQWNF